MGSKEIQFQCDRNGGGDDVIHITGSEWPVLGENSGDNDNGDDDDDDGAHSAVPPLVDRPSIGVALMVPLWFWFGTSVCLGAGWKMIIITIRKG